MFKNKKAGGIISIYWSIVLLAAVIFESFFILMFVSVPEVSVAESNFNSEIFAPVLPVYIFGNNEIFSQLKNYDQYSRSASGLLSSAINFRDFKTKRVSIVKKTGEFSLNPEYTYLKKNNGFEYTEKFFFYVNDEYYLEINLVLEYEDVE
ncbi:hypothetical protein JXM83_06010 [Candidatus Woesearchaeota archaeon]|nr:hypothetical protein [Candidatus Woesearchaeota archaeon]